MTVPPRHSDYPRVLISRALGAVILWLDFTLMFGSLAYRWNAEPLIVGVAMTLYGAPGVLLGPRIGVIADRVCPWQMLRWSYVIRGLAAVALWLSPTVGLFLACIVIKGLANLAPGPAEQQLFRRLLDDAALPGNASRVTLIDQIAKLIAPLVAAALATRQLPGFSVSLGLSLTGLMLLYVRAPNALPRAQTSTRTQTTWRVLHTVLREHSRLRRVFAVSLSQAFTLGLYDALLALFLKARDYPDGTFGSIVACTAAGAMLAAVMFKRMCQRFAPSTFLTVSCALFGFTVLAPAILVYLHVAIPASGMLALWVANGFAYGLGVMLTMITFQQDCPRDVLGTVTSTARSLQLLVMIVAPLIGSALSSVTSIEFVFLLAGGLSLLIGLVCHLSPRLPKVVRQ